jgi:hypothetical protein
MTLPVEISLQLLFQMLARRFLDRASLRHDGLFLRLPFFSRARIDRARQMGNFRPLRTYLPLLRFCVRIH